MIDSEKLISLVHDRNALWNKKSKHYHNRDIIRKLWDEIATEMEIKSDLLKTKWQNLRDTYKKELNKNKKPTGSGTGGCLSKWRFYETMSFLKDIETPRKMISNTPTPISDMSVNELENTMEINSPESECIDVVNEDNEATMGLDTSYEQIPAKKKTSKHDAINDLLNIERQKLHHFSKINENSQNKKPIVEDECFHFMVSLVPYLQELPDNRKLIIRHKLQQVFLEEQERCDNNRLNQSDLNLRYLQPPRSEEPNQASSNIIHNDSNQFITNYIQEPNQPFATTSSTYY